MKLQVTIFIEMLMFCAVNKVYDPTGNFNNNFNNKLIQ